MSTITKNWTEDKIRTIIRKLNEKTELNGAVLPIAFNSYECRALYQWRKNPSHHFTQA